MANPVAQDDAVPLEMDKLVFMLADVGLPPLIDRTATPQTTTDANQPTVVALSWPGERYAFLREGGRQAPGSVLLAMSPSWLERRRIGEDQFDLYLHRGAWLDERGQCYLDTWSPPRRVTYFLNFFTHAATYMERDDGRLLEQGVANASQDMQGLLVTPMSSSVMLEHRTGDKLLTRIVVARARVAVPETLALVLAPGGKRRLPRLENLPVEAHVIVRREDATSDRVLAIVRAFCQRMCSERGVNTRVVVKPSGPLWMGSKGVTFHNANSASAVEAAVAALALCLHDNDSLLIEEFCPVFPPQDVLVAREVPLNAVLNPSYIAETSRVSDALSLLSGEMQLVAADDNADECDITLQEEDITVASKARTASTSGSAISRDVTCLWAFRVRVLVQRAMYGPPVVAKMVCGVGPSDEPLHGVNTTPQSLEVTLRQWGVSGETHTQLVEALATEARVTFDALAEYESSLMAHERGGHAAQTDAIGIDFILTLRNSVIVPVAIEVNDHDSCYQSQLVEFFEPEKHGECTRAWVAYALLRSQEFIMRGKRVLLVGGGGHSKRFVFEQAQSMQLCVTLVDADENHHGAKLVQHFVHVPQADDHSDDRASCEAVLVALEASLGVSRGELGRHFDGVSTFWEDCVVLCAELAKALGLDGHDVNAARLVKSKRLTHQTLIDRGGDEVDWRPRAALYASPTLTIGDSVSSLDTAVLDDESPDNNARLEQLLADEIRAKTHTESNLAVFRFPAVLKNDYGSSAFGVKMVSTIEQGAQTALELLRFQRHGEETHPGCGLSFEQHGKVLLQPFVDGSEHDVDVVMWKGECLAAFISDNGPTRLPYFAETSACMPSLLHPHWRGALIGAATTCVRQLGLESGCFNVELKFTTSGPKLIEINGRMGGFYLRDWVRRVWGVDMALCSFAIACGIRPFLSLPKRPHAYLVGVMLHARQHGKALREHDLMNRLQIMHENGHVILNQFEKEVVDVEEFEEPIANLAVSHADVRTAKQHLCSILNVLGLENTGGVPTSFFVENL